MQTMIVQTNNTWFFLFSSKIRFSFSPIVSSLSWISFFNPLHHCSFLNKKDYMNPIAFVHIDIHHILFAKEKKGILRNNEYSTLKELVYPQWV